MGVVIGGGWGQPARLVLVKIRDMHDAQGTFPAGGANAKKSPDAQLTSRSQERDMIAHE